MPIQAPDRAKGICVFDEVEAGTKFDQWLTLLQSLTTKTTITVDEECIRFVHIPIYGHKKVCCGFFTLRNSKKGLK